MENCKGQINEEVLMSVNLGPGPWEGYLTFSWHYLHGKAVDFLGLILPKTALVCFLGPQKDLTTFFQEPGRILAGAAAIFYPIPFATSSCQLASGTGTLGGP